MVSEFDLLYKFLLIAMAIPITDMGIKLTKGRVKLATSKLGTRHDLGRLNGNDGLILSKQCQLSFKKTLEGVCVVGPTGEGKSTSIMLPNLLSNHLPKSSIIVADPKGELHNLTHKYQESIGRRTILFEPLGNNAHYNPLDHCSDFTESRELASNLLINGELAIQLASGKNGGSSEWTNMSIPLFTSTILNSKTISQAVKFLINSTPKEITETLGESKNEDIKEQFRIFMSAAGSPKTLSSILSTLLTSLQLFTDHKLINSTSKSDFSPIDFRKEPTILYIKYDEAKSNYLSPFLSVFYSQLINKIMYAEGLPVLFLLDEMQNVGRLSNFEQVVAVSRSKNIGFLICLQNLVKLYDIYGKNNTTTILNNLKSKVILPSLSDYDALSYLSNLCGDKEVNTESHNRDNISTSKTVKKLFTADEIRRIEDDKLLIIAHNKLPFLDKQNTYYTQDKYTNNII